MNERGDVSLENVLLLLIREGFNKGCFFMLVSLFDYTNTCYQYSNQEMSSLKFNASPNSRV